MNQLTVNDFMAWTRARHCFMTGRRDRVEAAHLWLPTRRGLPSIPRTDRHLDRTHTSHKGRFGLFCFPLTWEYHSQQSPYPFSYHKLGQRRFFEHHGIDDAEVFAYVADNLAHFFLGEIP